jgi:hypothetical protein
MAKRSGHRKGKHATQKRGGREDRDRDINLDEWEVVTHAANRDEADFYRRLIGEHDIEVLFSDDLDGYEPEEGEEGIAILVPEDEVDTAYHLIKDHEEYVAGGGLSTTDDEDTEEQDDDDTRPVHGDHGDYEPIGHGDEEDEDEEKEEEDNHEIGSDDEDDGGGFSFEDDEH